MVIAAAGGLLAACDDTTGIDWSYFEPDTVLLYSLSDAGYFGMPSAYDFVYGGSVVVEFGGASGWDIAVVDDDAGGFSFLMPGAIQGYPPTSSILAVEDTPFDSLERAPTEGYDSTSIAVDPAAVYIVRTRSTVDAYGNTCRYYAKLEPVAMDSLDATLTFRYLANPNCNSRGLVPADGR